MKSFFKTASAKIYHGTLIHNKANQLLPNDKILDWSKLTEFQDNHFKFDENGRMFFKRTENTVGKGEIARYEQFLLLPTVFSKDMYCRHLKPGLVRERVNEIEFHPFLILFENLINLFP